MDDFSKAIKSRDTWLDSTLSLPQYHVGTLEGSVNRARLQHWLANGTGDTKEFPASLIKAQKKVWELSYGQD